MINKLVITKSAIFDYEEIVSNKPLDTTKLRASVEKLLNGQNFSGEELRLEYGEGDSEAKLLLFIRRGYKFGLMQTWILEGICSMDDYHVDMEDSGAIREWLEVILE